VWIISEGDVVPKLKMKSGKTKKYPYTAKGKAAYKKAKAKKRKR